MKSMSLRDCRDWVMIHEPGLRCPSLITLKRWSAQGKLDKAKNGSARQAFSCSKLVEILRDLNPKAQPQAQPQAQSENGQAASASGEVTTGAPKHVDNHEDTLTPNVAPNVALKLEDVLDLVQTIAHRLSAIESRVQSIQESAAPTATLVRAIDNLDSIRKMLMLRHDEAITQLKARIEAAEDVAKHIKAMGDLPLELERLQRMLATIHLRLPGNGAGWPTP